MLHSVVSTALRSASELRRTGPSQPDLDHTHLRHFPTHHRDFGRDHRDLRDLSLGLDFELEPDDSVSRSASPALPPTPHSADTNTQSEHTITLTTSQRRHPHQTTQLHPQPHLHRDPPAPTPTHSQSSTQRTRSKSFLSALKPIAGRANANPRHPQPVASAASHSTNAPSPHAKYPLARGQAFTPDSSAHSGSSSVAFPVIPEHDPETNNRGSHPNTRTDTPTLTHTDMSWRADTPRSGESHPSQRLRTASQTLPESSYRLRTPSQTHADSSHRVRAASQTYGNASQRQRTASQSHTDSLAHSISHSIANSASRMFRRRGTHPQSMRSSETAANSELELTDDKLWVDGDFELVSSDLVRFRVPSFYLYASSAAFREAHSSTAGSMAAGSDDDMHSGSAVDDRRSVTFTDVCESAAVLRLFLDFVVYAKLDIPDDGTTLDSLQVVRALVLFLQKYECSGTLQLMLVCLRELVRQPSNVSPLAAFVAGATASDAFTCSVALDITDWTWRMMDRHDLPAASDANVFDPHHMPVAVWQLIPPMYTWALTTAWTGSEEHLHSRRRQRHDERDERDSLSRVSVRYSERERERSHTHRDPRDRDRDRDDASRCDSLLSRRVHAWQQWL